MATTIVAPLRSAASSAPLTGLLYPRVTIEGSEWVVVMPQLAAVPVKVLKPSGQNLLGDRERILAAVDRLYFGI